MIEWIIFNSRLWGLFMFRSLKLQIYLFAFVPFAVLAVVSVVVQVLALNQLEEEVSSIAEQAIIETEKRRLVTVIDSSLSIISPYLDKPGREGLQDALDLLYSYRFDNGTGYLFSYDLEGNRLMSGSNKGIGQNFIDSKDKLGNFIVRNILKAATTGEGFTTYYFPKKGETEPSAKYSYALYIEKWDIVIATGFFIDGTEAVLNDIQDALGETKGSSLLKNILIILALSVLVGVISYLSISAILTALNALRHSVERLADGEGDLTASLPHSYLDILDDIASNFNRFLSAMAKDINDLKHACEELNNIATLSNQQREVLESSSQAQVNETTSVAAAVEEMSSTAIEIARNAEQTKDSAESTESEVQDVLKQVHVSGSELNELNDVLSNVEQSVQELGGNVEAINSVLTVIQGISEQTNLLALNAAIEAARAGELGRGFAVVADEVRSLAQRSQESTVEIKDILENLQSSANKTIKDMGNTTEKRQAVVEAMQAITKIIDSSSNSIKGLTLMNIEVATAASEQSKVVDQMAQSISDIAGLAEDMGDNSKNASQQFKRLEEQSKLIQNVTKKFKT